MKNDKRDKYISELSKMKVNEDLSTIVRDMHVNDPESNENSLVVCKGINFLGITET